MYKCKVCGKEFELSVDNHYISKEPGKIGLAALVESTEKVLHDSFDCPYCGCQNRAQSRELNYFEPELCEAECGAEEDEEEEMTGPVHMSLHEAILHLRSLSDDERRKCQADFGQVADWLQELMDIKFHFSETGEGEYDVENE